MLQHPRSAIAETWQQWEGRVVNGCYPLGQCFGGQEQSAVYLTSHNGSRAAIKLIPADASDAPGQLARWELAARLSHPHLIRILNVGRWHADDKQDLLFCVMECADENLAESRRALTASEARQMLDPTLDALRYLHGRGLIHNRLRPENVMAVGEELKLSSDWVRRTGKTEATAAVADNYEAPEVGKGVLAPSGDIWSLGMMLMRALTNRMPEYDSNHDVKVPSLPAPFDEIVKHCLNHDPEKRLSASEIKKRLERPTVETLPTPMHAAKAPDKAVKHNAATISESTRPQPHSSSNTPEHATGRHPSVLGKRGMVATAAVLSVISALLVGLRVTKGRSQPEQATMTTAARSSPFPVASTWVPPISARISTGEPEASVDHEVLPEIAAQARNSISGTVKVKVRVSVDTSGKVSRATLAARGPSPYFAKQALEAGRQWSFVPPQSHGGPAGSELVLNFEFRRSGTRAKAQRVS